MPLRAKKPIKAEQRLKVFLYGEYKVGKTYAACQFPSTYFMDTEKGASHDQYVDLLEASNSVYLAASTYDEIITEVKALMQTKHEYRTLVIDSISVIYADLIETGERIKGDEYGKHTYYANTRMRRLWNLLFRLDMNVVMTSQAKVEYLKEPGSRASEATGYLRTDAWDKLPYFFDLVIELRKKGDRRQAEVRGSRLTEFPDGHKFTWSYEEFEKKLGAGILGREAKVIPLVSEEDLQTIKALMRDCEIQPKVEEGWLKKAKASKLEDLPADKAKKVLDWLKNRAAA